MSSQSDWPPAGWHSDTFPHDRHRHRYYVLDAHDGRPSVLLMHEFPGISQDLVKLAKDLSQEFRVVVPSIVGRDGDPSALGTLARLCIRREIVALRAGRTSPAVPWLRSLLDKVVASGEGRPCGVIGMCMTGGFALALAIDTRVRAAVVAQPALPISGTSWFQRLPGLERLAADMGLSAQDRTALCSRVKADPDGLRVRGYRFDNDWMSPKQKLDTARDLLGDNAMCVTPLPDPVGPGHAHSTLTGSTRNTAAIAQVKDFLRNRLC